MLFTDMVETSRQVASRSGRLAKVALLAETLRRLTPKEIEAGVAILSGELRQGRLGIGHATLRRASMGAAPPEPVLSVAEVDQALQRIAEVTGRGAASGRQRLLEELLTASTPPERDFLNRLLLGELRQGALQGIMVDSIARAAGVAAARVRRALMFAGELPLVARVAIERGVEGLSSIGPRLLRPLQPMLAQTAEDVDDALERLQRAGLEYKIDGARIQVHRADDEVRVFTRRFNDVTATVPEIVEAVLRLGSKECILDGEAVALRSDGTPHAFQTTMRRFGRKKPAGELRRSLPLSALFFDCLWMDGESMVELPARERFEGLRQLLTPDLLIPRLDTDESQEAAAFLERALASGHEGVVAKSLEAPYEAGRRGKAWLKLKPSFTLDLVVLAAEWGSGRRKGRLSNLHLGARNSASGGFVMLGKTFKGLTDEMLAWQTERLLALEVERERHVVRVRPRLVVEIAFDGVQESPQCPSGLALRFARVKRFRVDKAAEDADTIEAVRAIHLRRRKRDE